MYPDYRALMRTLQIWNKYQQNPRFSATLISCLVCKDIAFNSYFGFTFFIHLIVIICEEVALFFFCGRRVIWPEKCSFWFFVYVNTDPGYTGSRKPDLSEKVDNHRRDNRYLQLRFGGFVDPANAKKDWLYWIPFVVYPSERVSCCFHHCYHSERNLNLKVVGPLLDCACFCVFLFFPDHSGVTESLFTRAHCGFSALTGCPVCWTASLGAEIYPVMRFEHFSGLFCCSSFFFSYTALFLTCHCISV